LYTPPVKAAKSVAIEPSRKGWEIEIGDEA
jgi:hypothetical protein